MLKKCNVAASEDVIYRIITCEEWASAQKSGVIPYGDIDRRDGYLHLSTQAQTLETAARYFAGVIDLLALEIMCADIEGDLRFEPVDTRGGERFPHLYDQLPVDSVWRVLRLSETDGAFQLTDEV